MKSRFIGILAIPLLIHWLYWYILWHFPERNQLTETLFAHSDVVQDNIAFYSLNGYIPILTRCYLLKKKKEEATSRLFNWKICVGKSTHKPKRNAGVNNFWRISNQKYVLSLRFKIKANKYTRFQLIVFLCCWEYSSISKNENENEKNIQCLGAWKNFFR